MIRINDQAAKPLRNFWSNIHFHPTDAIEDDWGRYTLDNVAKDHAAITVRMYSMFEDIVKKDENGRLVYDFTKNDVRIDYMVSRGFNLLISYNFIPPCISGSDDRSNTEVRVGSRYKGKFLATEPPEDWSLWEEICYEYTKHLVERYGLELVSTWYLQCFNEPDVSGFFMKSLGKREDAREIRLSEYIKMYEAFERATRRVSEKLKIGGPTASNVRFFEPFIACASEKKLKLDFACAHSYGTNPAAINEGRRQIGVQNNINTINGYITKLRQYYKDIEMVVDEWGASGAGFCNLEDCPKLIFRENEVFSAFFAKLICECVKQEVDISKLMICLSGSHQPHQMENHFPEFNGFRSFFTEHFIKKPIYNAYVLAAKLKEKLFECDPGVENLSVLATGGENGVTVLLAYASADFSEDLPEVNDSLKLNLDGKYKVTKWLIDKNTTNPYRVWEREKLPAFPSEKELGLLREAGEMKPIAEYEIEAAGETGIDFTLSANGIMLIDFEKI